MDPINYTGLQTQVNPGQALLGGLQTGAAFSDRQFQNDQQALALQAQQRQQQDLVKLMQNPSPTAKDYADYTLRNPAQAEAAKQSFSLLDESRQKQTIGIASQVYSALQSGRQDIAQQLLEQQHEALKNGGNPGDLQANETLMQVVKDDPDVAKHMAGTFLASAMGPKNFASTFENLSKEARENALAPVKQQQAELGLEDTQSKIDTRASDLEIKKADTQIKALTANIAKEGNEIKKATLQEKLDAAKQKHDQLTRDKAAGTESSIASMDNAIDTISKLETHPGLVKVLGPIDAMTPTIPGTPAADAEALIEQLQSQTFLGAVSAMKGMGALSDAEGAKINNSVASLNKKQSESQFKAQLKSIRTIFEQGRQRAAKQAGTTIAPRQGVVMNHPVYGAITNERMEAAAKKAGITVDQLREKLQGNQ